MPSARISIWFFIGTLLVAYGLLILSYGVWTLMTGKLPPVALANLYAPVWWGAGLLALGLFYVLKYRPGKARA